MALSHRSSHLDGKKVSAAFDDNDLTDPNTSAVDPLKISGDGDVVMADIGASSDKSSSNSDSKDKNGQSANGSSASSVSEDAASGTSSMFTDVIEIPEVNPSSSDDASKRKKRKETKVKETVKKPAVKTRVGRLSTASVKSPTPAAKAETAKAANSKDDSTPTKSTNRGAKQDKSANITSRRSSTIAERQTATGSGERKYAGSSGVGDSKSASPSPKPAHKPADDEERNSESTGPKVPPLKIVIPGGIGSANSGGSQAEDNVGNRKGKSGRSSLPHKKCSVSIPSESTSKVEDTTTDKDVEPAAQTSESSSAQQSSSTSTASQCPASSSMLAGSSATTSSVGSSAPVKLPPRKRKVKSAKEHHTAETVKQEPATTAHPHQMTNSFQMYFNIRKQIERRQKGVFPVQPKPPKGFKDYLMNRCTYVLQKNAKPDPVLDFPTTLPTQMRDEFTVQEKERHNLRVQHQVEKEKLVLAVEQEILRVHGRAARALANQALPFSACTFLRGREVYNMLTPEQEEKERNALRPRYNGRLFLSWLQEVDDKWEKIKEGMVRRHHNEAESLHAVQTMDWEWKMKELGLCDTKVTPTIDNNHVPMVLVSEDFDLLPD